MTQATFEITTPQVWSNEVRTPRARHSVTAIDRELQLLPPTSLLDLSRTEPETIVWNETEAHVGGDPIIFYESGTIASVAIDHPLLISAPSTWTYTPGIYPMFEAATHPVTQPTDVILTASSDDSDGMVDRLRVVLLPSAGTPFVQDFAMETSTVVGGQSALGNVTLSSSAPTGGITITLSGSRAGLAAVPASVTVPAGETVGTFTIATHPTSLTRGVLVTATYGAQTRTTILSVQPPPTNPAIWTPVAAKGNTPGMQQPEEDIPGPMTSSSAISTSSADPILIARHLLYTPELNLMMETAATNTATKTILHEYIWFAGQPLAQISTQTGTIHWYFNDHLGTPILQTDTTATVTWRAEYEPYRKIFAVRAGGEKDQPLRFPGQEEDGELAYNIFRWYRNGWGGIRRLTVSV